MTRHKKDCPCSDSALKATKHHLPILRKLLKAGKTSRKKIFEAADNCLIKYIASCCKGVLNGHIILPDKEYSKLPPYKQDLLFLANSRAKLKDKRANLMKKGGGFLSIILPAITSALVGLFGNYLLKQ